MTFNENAFFVTSKLAYYLMLPETWLALIIIFDLVCQILNYTVLARKFAFISTLLILIIGFFPFSMPGLQWLETRYPPNPKIEQLDGVIVLGGAEDPKGLVRWNQVQLNAASERLTEALLLARRFPKAKILFTGGSNILTNIAENLSPSIAAERFFLEQGISSDRLIFERKSRNTHENAVLSYKLAQHLTTQKWALITSSYHMMRAMRSFEAAGWSNLIAYPVDFNSTNNYYEAIYWNLSGNMQGINVLVKEYVGLIIYSILNL